MILISGPNCILHLLTILLWTPGQAGNLLRSARHPSGSPNNFPVQNGFRSSIIFHPVMKFIYWEDPATRLFVKTFLNPARGGIYMFLGDLSYLQSAALMSRAVMNYVNDSAPLHFASAMNAPVTAVYCSTIPEFGFGPVSDVQNIVEVEEKLSCRPCGLHGYSSCPLGHFKCAMDIQEGQLLKTVPL